MSFDIATYLDEKGVAVKAAAGSDNIHCPCFFHGEDPTDKGRLYINVTDTPARGLWTCFVCGESGNLNKIRLHFKDAALASIRTEDSSALPDETFCRIQQTAADFYHDQLCENIEVFRYLRDDRGLSVDTIREFRLGWAADDGLLTHLVREGFNKEDIIKTGLVRQDGSDLLSNRITIPYMVMGQAVWIRGRDYGNHSKSKYMGPAGVEAWLFNADKVLGADQIVICEGEIDAISMHQLGFKAIGVPGSQIWKPHWTEAVSEARRINILFDNDSAGRRGAEKLATTLGTRARIVSLPETLPGQKELDANEWMAGHGKVKEDFEYLFLKASGGLLVSVRECFEVWQQIEGNPDLTGLRFDITSLDSQMRHGLLPGSVNLMFARTNVGKHHPCNSIVPTPDGPMKWGDLVVGDEVIGSDGKPTEVTDIFDRGVLPCYRVHFSDGTSTLAGLDHIWTVEYIYGHKCEWVRKDMTTEELIASDLKKRNAWRYRIPMIEPVEYSPKQLPIGPYTLGALIANGGMSDGSPVLITPDSDVVARVVAEGTQVSAHKVFDCPRYGILGIKHIIESMGLNVKSRDKFIPDEYLLGSVDQRFALLQGLMDGDGSNVSKSKATNRRSVVYHTTSPRLAEDVQKLVSSLGGTGIISSHQRTGTKGPYLDIRVSIMLPAALLNRLFTNRKDSNFDYTHKHVPHRAITKIEYECDDNSRCIKVAAKDSLYAIGENYILTHNTIMTLNLFHRMARVKPDIKILFISLEQTRNEWWERARRIHTFFEPESSDQDTLGFWESKIMVVDKNRVTEDQLMDTIDQFEFEMGAKPDLVGLDYLGYYARGFKGEAYERANAAVMGMKYVAKEKKVVMLSPHQVNRSNALGNEVSLASARDSGVIEETADFVAGMWTRDQQVGQTKESYKKEIEFKVLKSRQGGVGQTVTFQFAPLTLATVPKCDPDFERALDERAWWMNGDSWETAVERHKTGNKDPFLGSKV